VKNRMIMSILALVSAALLLVFATFAWFVTSNNANLGGTTLNVIDVDVTLSLQSSESGSISPTDTYTTSIDSIDFENAIPGEVFYYRLKIENTGNIAITTRVLLYGFVDGLAVSPPIGYNNPNSLLSVLLFESSNTDNLYNLSSATLLSRISGSPDFTTASIVIANDITLEVDEIQYVYFSFTFPGNTVGNDYRNLKLLISQIQVSLAY